MNRRRLVLMLVLAAVAVVTVFGCGACCLVTPHRCAPNPTGVAAPRPHQAFTADGITHEVYEFGGDGPDVILLHELPGLTLDTIALAEKLVAEHYTVHVPLIFGQYGDRRAVKAGFKKCFNELHCFGDGDSRFAGWLRALIAQRYGRREVVVIGMCLTGSVALEVADAPNVSAVVMAQPSLPLPLTRWQRGKISVTDAHAAQIRSLGRPILAMRFSEDCMASRDRFATLRKTFDAKQIEFEEIDSTKCKEKHATLTGDFSEQAFEHLKRFLAAHARP